MDSTVGLIYPAPRTFFGVPSLRELDKLDAQVAFLGVPYDGDLVGAILDSTEIDPNRLLQQVLSYRTAEVTRAVVADEPPSRFVAMISSPPGRALDPRAARLVGSSWARERAQ